MLKIFLLFFYLSLTLARQVPGRNSLFFRNINKYPAMDCFCTRTDSDCIEEPVRVGTWNLQRFGVTKADKPEVMGVIVQVIKKFDLIVLLEVTDSSGTSVPELHQLINQNLPVEEQYEVIQSPRLGRSTYREQYVTFYKQSKVSLVQELVYNDTKDVFQFEPFMMHFNTTKMGSLTDFIVIPLHAKPSDAVKEIDAMVEVYESVQQIWGIPDAVILGDFNAGCSYVVQGEFETMRLYNQSNKYHWVIDDHADTTAKTTTCPYDRIVLAGAAMQKAAYYDTASEFYYDEEFNITDIELIEDISDHYPVGVMVRGSVPSTVSTRFVSTNSPSVSLSVPLSPDCWGAAYALAYGLQQGDCSPTSTITTSTNDLIAEWTTDGINDALELIIGLSEDYSLVVSRDVVALVGYKMAHGVLNDHTLYVPGKDPQQVTVGFTCMNNNAAPACRLSVSAVTGIN